MNEILKGLQHISVLLVEDDVGLREVVKGLLKPYVRQIYEAKDGLEGLEVFKANNINLIISDINMTKMSGTSMARHIRELDSQVPIIFVTAFDTDENLQNSICIENSNFLKKPFDKQQLLITMLRAVKVGTSVVHRLTLGHGFSYDTQSRVLYNGDESVALTRTEQRLLHILAINQGQVVSFSMIENFTWSGKVASFETMRNYINRLRTKTYPALIKNIQGIGYKLSFDE